LYWSWVLSDVRWQTPAPACILISLFRVKSLPTKDGRLPSFCADPNYVCLLVIIYSMVGKTFESMAKSTHQTMIPSSRSECRPEYRRRHHVAASMTHAPSRF
jgi:hypothetical protein